MNVKYYACYSGQQAERCISGLSQNSYSVVVCSSFKNQQPSKEYNVVSLLSFLTQLLIAHVVVSYFSDYICCLYICFSPMWWHQSNDMMHFPMEMFYNGIKLPLEMLSVAFPELDFCGCCFVVQLGLLMRLFVS